MIAIIAILPVAAHADELSREANINLALQIGDALTTRQAIHNGGTEQNSISAPFVKSNLSSVAFAIGANAILRMVLHNTPKAFHLFDIIEIGASVNNLHSRAGPLQTSTQHTLSLKFH